MFASFQKKYFLSDKGVAGVKRGIFWTTLTNLITMAGMGFLFLVMAGFVEHLATGADLPDALPIVGGLLVFFVLLFASNWQQYYYTYCIFYEECGKQRMEIAERLRKLPLSFFGRRDLADLTETIMGDVQTMEHAYSHVLGELWGRHYRKRYCVRSIAVLLLAVGDHGVLERSRGLCRAVFDARPHGPGVRPCSRREGQSHRGDPGDARLCARDPRYQPGGLLS